MLNVFANINNVIIFIRLQVVDVERDINKAKEGAGDELVYKTITGLKSDLSIESKPVLLQNTDKSTDKSESLGT